MNSPAPFNARDLLWLAAVVVAGVGWCYSYQRAESLEDRLRYQQHVVRREFLDREREFSERLREDTLRAVERKLAENRAAADAKDSRADDLDDLFSK